MKLEDFIKAAIVFYEHNTHKKATYVKPDPKKNKFEIKCGRLNQSNWMIEKTQMKLI
jgi:hypothetical protein